MAVGNFVFFFFNLRFPWEDSNCMDSPRYLSLPQNIVKENQNWIESKASQGKFYSGIIATGLEVFVPNWAPFQI